MDTLVVVVSFLLLVLIVGVSKMDGETLGKEDWKGRGMGGGVGVL